MENNNETMTQETTEEKYIVDENDDVLVKTDEDPSENPEPTDPASKETTGEEDKPGQKDEDKPDPEDTETAEDTDDPYKDKSREELLEMLKNSQSKIGQQGNELGDVKKSLKALEQKVTQNDSPDELRKQITTDDMKDGLKQEQRKLVQLQNKLSKLDPYDSEKDYTKLEQEIMDQQILVQELNTDLMLKNDEERYLKNLTSKANQEFLAKQKDQLQRNGFELSDDEFQELQKQAENYLDDDGKYTETAIHKALIDNYGHEKYAAHLKLLGEEKARKEISTADSRKDRKANVSPTGNTGKTNYKKFMDMTPHERDNFLDNLSGSELESLRKKINRQK